MVEKNLPYPLNANPTTDEDRYGANADFPDVAAVAARVADLEDTAIVKTPMPTVDGNYVLKCSVSGNKKTYSWVSAENIVPNLPTAAGTYKLTVTVDDGDTTYSWSAEDANEL